MKIIFYIYPENQSNIRGLATISKDELTSIELYDKVSKGYYYSVLNDAIKEAGELFQQGRFKNPINSEIGWVVDKDTKPEATCVESLPVEDRIRLKANLNKYKNF